jgi:two-component system response regulator
METHLNATLLVAEDDEDDQFFIQDAIDTACPPQVKARFVGDGIELLEYLRRDGASCPRPKLIILDLNMPHKDGREALQEMKADPIFADIPVVILTTSHAEEDVSYCRSHGAAGYYHKPNSLQDLQDILYRLCIEYLE